MFLRLCVWSLLMGSFVNTMELENNKRTKILQQDAKSIETTDNKASDGFPPTLLESLPATDQGIGQTTVSSPVDVCSQYGFCPPRSRSTSWYCQCDDLCQVYDDCCQDYQVTTFLPREDIYRCIRTDHFQPHNLLGIFAIAVCPDHFMNSTIVNGCLTGNVKHEQPVIDNTNSSRIFANHYCALCNYVYDTTPMTVQIHYDRQQKINIEDFMNLETLDSLLSTNPGVKFRLIMEGQANFRPCIYGITSTTNQTCPNFVNPVALSTMQPVYLKNFLCINESLLVKIASKEVLIVCFGKTQWTGRTPYIRVPYVLSNFGQKQNTELCKVWKKEISWICSGLPTFVNIEEPVQLVLEIKPNSTTLDDDQIIQIGLLGLWSFIVPEMTELYDMAEIFMGDEGRIVKVSTTAKIRKRCFAEEVKEIQNGLRNQTINIIVKGENQTLMFANQPDEYSNNLTFIKGYRMFFPFQNYLEENKMKITSMQRHRLCQNLTVFAQRAAKWLEVYDIRCDNGGVFADKIMELIKAIATYTCLSLSIVSMVPLIFLNRRTENTMTVPRINLEKFALSIILANSLFIVGISMKDMPTVCYIAAVGFHYLLLTAFVYMTIGVFTASVALSGLRRNDPQTEVNHNHNRRVLTLLGLSLPLFVVCTSFAIDRFGPPSWSPGYTSGLPTNFPGNIAFFYGPLVLLSITNGLCLLTVMVKIRKTDMETRKLMKESSIFEVVQMYLRLMALGVALWINGIIAAIVRFDWLDFVFVLSVGLHGFFISIACLTTKENKKRIKNVFART